jgi:hypothetical protein
MADMLFVAASLYHAMLIVCGVRMTHAIEQHSGADER